MSVEVYESYNHNGVDATVISMVLDGVTVFTVIDSTTTRPLQSGVVSLVTAVNQRALWMNTTVNAIVVPITLGVSRFSGRDTVFSQLSYTPCKCFACPKPLLHLSITLMCGDLQPALLQCCARC